MFQQPYYLSISPEFKPAILQSKSQEFTSLDIYCYLVLLGTGMPYAIYLACVIWNLDGPYWVIHDFAPAPEKRTLALSLSLFLIRTIFLLIGFLETSRFIMTASILFLIGIFSVDECLVILTHRVKESTCFLKYYLQLTFTCHFLSPAASRGLFCCITLVYFLLIQTFWIVVKGWDKLHWVVYSLFAAFSIQAVLAALVFLPKVSNIGEMISNLPKMKYQDMKRKYFCGARTKTNFIAMKRAKALVQIEFSYGAFYPLGKKFTRNTVGNLIENFLTCILLINI